MRLTTLCYIEKDGKYLMLHRTKKKNDENHDKWIGVGGKFELGESPDECLIDKLGGLNDALSTLHRMIEKQKK